MRTTSGIRMSWSPASACSLLVAAGVGSGALAQLSSRMGPRRGRSRASPVAPSRAATRELPTFAPICGKNAGIRGKSGQLAEEERCAGPDARDRVGRTGCARARDEQGGASRTVRAGRGAGRAEELALQGPGGELVAGGEL